MHTLDIVHLDIKPENLLLSRDAFYPHLQIADFGFAKQFIDGTDKYVQIAIEERMENNQNSLELKEYEYSMTGCVGTLYYNAPEIHLKYIGKNDNNPINKKSDIFSVGCVI